MLENSLDYKLVCLDIIVYTLQVTGDYDSNPHLYNTNSCFS